MANRTVVVKTEHPTDTDGPFRKASSGDVLVDGDGNAIGNLNGIILQTGTTAVEYATITLALAAAIAGNVVLVPPGTYAESFTIPAGVVLRSTGGVTVTVISGAAATGTRITLGGTSSKITGFTVLLPTDAVPAISYAGAVTATATSIIFTGAGASGVGIRNSGAGTLIVSDMAYVSGACDAIVEATAGTIVATDGSGSGGTATDVFRVSGGGRIIVQNYALVSAGYTDLFHVADGEIEVIGVECENATTAVHVTHGSGEFKSLAMRVEDSITNHLLVDPGILSATIHISGGEMNRSKVSYDAGCTDVILQFQDDRDGDKGMVIHGELAVGRPQNGKESVFGEGDSYVRNMVVITTDNTAGAAADGGNLTDVSAAAQSYTGSTFTFQGVTANHTILIGSDNYNAAAIALKFWGIKVKQTTAAVEVTAKSFVFEIWNGAAWVEIKTMATESNLYYRYGNRLFIRANSSEHIRFGTSPTTTWATKAISGKTLYWARIRIAITVTTAPVFEQFKLSCSRFEANPDGTNTYHGTARFRRTVAAAGNVFGEGGSVGDVGIPVGSGGLPTGWTHNVKNSELNSDGNAVMTQFTLPRGIDTSRPLNVEIFVLGTPGGATAPSVRMSLLPVQVEGILVADPTGGIVPTARTLANTETVTAKVAQTQSNNTMIISSTKIGKYKFIGFDVSNYYEGDILFIWFEMQDDGASTVDIAVLSFEVSGVIWTHGNPLAET